MTEFFRSFPAVWGFFGILFASGTFLIANRYIFQWQKEATTNLRDTLLDRIKTLEIEKLEYKTSLHSERENHQATKLKCQELENRPDISLLFEMTKRFYDSHTEFQSEHTQLMRQQTETMKTIGGSVEASSAGIKELLNRSRT